MRVRTTHSPLEIFFFFKQKTAYEIDCDWSSDVCSSDLTIGALDRLRQGDPRGDADLAEDVPQVRLDRLLAEEELRGDLGIRLAVDDEPRDLELAFGQRLDRGPAGFARPRAAVDAMAEPSQLALRLVPVAQGPALFERAGRVLQ